jgi:UDP-MurNAc hydroxylase
MILKNHKSSTLEIVSGSTRILTDSWLMDGEYYGSRYHVPSYEFEPDNFSDLDAIYISYIHPDYASAETLKRLPAENDPQL